MNLNPIAERIRAQCSLFKLVGGAAQLDAAIKQGLTTVPAAFVLPAAEKSDPSPFANGVVEQHVDLEFSVVVAVRNLADATGAAAVDELDPVRGPLFDALLAWPPADGYFCCEHRSGRLLYFDNGVLWWADVFSTATLIRSF